MIDFDFGLVVDGVVETVAIVVVVVGIVVGNVVVGIVVGNVVVVDLVSGFHICNSLYSLVILSCSSVPLVLLVCSGVSVGHRL